MKQGTKKIRQMRVNHVSTCLCVDSVGLEVLHNVQKLVVDLRIVSELLLHLHSAKANGSDLEQE